MSYNHDGACASLYGAACDCTGNGIPAPRPLTHVVIYLNGDNDSVDEVYGFASEEAAQAWIDDDRNGYGYLVHRIDEPPQRPQNLTAELTWEPSERADYYRVSLDGGVTWRTTSERKIDLKPGHNDIIVQAINANGLPLSKESR